MVLSMMSKGEIFMFKNKNMAITLTQLHLKRVMYVPVYLIACDIDNNDE